MFERADKPSAVLVTKTLFPPTVNNLLSPFATSADAPTFTPAGGGVGVAVGLWAVEGSGLGVVADVAAGVGV